MLRGLVLRFLFGVAGLWIAAQIVPGIAYRNLGSLLAAAAILGVINAVIRPILVILTLPLTLVTFGLFLLVINAFTLKLVTLFLHGFHVPGFWPAFAGALIVSIATWVGQALAEPRRGWK
jgi:putative membrane protein